jgi:hypothetical protein
MSLYFLFVINVVMCRKWGEKQMTTVYCVYFSWFHWWIWPTDGVVSYAVCLLLLLSLPFHCLYFYMLSYWMQVVIVYVGIMMRLYIITYYYIRLQKVLHVMCIKLSSCCYLLMLVGLCSLMVSPMYYCLSLLLESVAHWLHWWLIITLL